MGRSAEQHLVSSIINEQSLQVALNENIVGSMFRSYPEEWTWLEKFYAQHRKTPARLTFCSKFPDFRLLKSADTAHHAEEVRKAHARHELITVLDQAAEYIAAGNLERAVEIGSAGMITVAANIGMHRDTDIFEDFADVLTDVEDRVARVTDGGLAGLPTGFETLDERCGGMQPGWLVVVGARQGVGKSWILTKLAVEAAKAGHRVQYDTLEMTRPQVAMRIHNLLSGEIGANVFNAINLARGRDFNMDNYRVFVKQLKEQMKSKMNVFDQKRGQLSPLTVAAQIERNQPDIVFIDYITLMQKTGDGDHRSIGQLSEALQRMSKEYDIPIVCAAQLNREHGITRSGAPPVEAIGQSDNIGADADLVITASKMSESVLQMYIAKFRHGVSGYKFYTQFQPDKGIFKEVSRNEAEKLKDADAEAEDVAAVSKKIRLP